MQNLLIRKLRPADDAALTALYAQSVAANPKGFIQDVNHNGSIVQRAREFETNGGAILGLFNDDTLIGFGGLRKDDDDTAELCKLHLNADYQGQGLGKKMVLELMQTAEQLCFKKIILHVTVTQETAIGLYKSLGFAETDRKVYVIGEASFDTLFMECKLD